MSEQVHQVTIAPGAPGRLLAVATPLTAVLLVVVQAGRGGLRAAVEDPVPPRFVAIVTLGVSLVLGWRALTQYAVLGDDRLECRNALSTFRVRWGDVEELRVVRRPGLVVVEVRVRGLRRAQRLGAASRTPGVAADAVLGELRAHPRAGALLVDHDP